MNENNIETMIDAKNSAQRVERYGRQKEAEFCKATISRPRRANVTGGTSKGGEGNTLGVFSADYNKMYSAVHAERK